MNYYNQIKETLLNNEINKKVKELIPLNIVWRQ